MNIDEMITKLRQAHQAGKSITVKDGGAYVSVDLNADAPTTSKLSRGDMRLDAVVTNPPNLTAEEAQDLEAFRNQLAEQNVEARRVAMNGGVAGIVQKNRVEASWLHANIHTQGNQ